MSVKIYAYDKEWVPLDKNGQIRQRKTQFAYLKRGKIVVADTEKVLSALQDFKEGKDSAVQNGPHLPFRRIKPHDRRQHVETSSCNQPCCRPNTNSRPDHTHNVVPRVRSASIQTTTAETVDASIQTSAAQRKSINIEATPKKLHPKSSHEASTAENLQSNPSNKVTTPKHVEASSKPASKTIKRRQSVACYTDQPNKKRKCDMLEVIAKIPIIPDDNATVPFVKSLTDSRQEVIVPIDKIDAMRSFFMEHLRNFNLLKFDEGGSYQLECLYLLTPIVRIERSKEIYRMLCMDRTYIKIDSQDEINQKHFVSNLGLRSISEKSSPQRYRMRKNIKQTNDKHSENNGKSKKEESTLDSKTDFEEIKTKMVPKERHEAKPSKKTYRKDKVVSTKTLNNVKDTDNDKNLYCSSSDGDVISKYHQKNKNKTKDIDLTLSESDSDNNNDDNKQHNFKTTLKRNKKPNTSHKNEKKVKAKNNQTTKLQKIKNKTIDIDQTLSISDSDSNDDDNKPNAKTTLERDRKGRFLKPKNYGDNQTGNNNTFTSNTKKNQIEESSFEISESDSNTEDVTPPRKIQTRRSTINVLGQNELNNSRKRQNIPDNDTQTNSRLRKRQNVIETKTLTQNSEDDFATGPSKKKLEKPIEINDEQCEFDKKFENKNNRNNNMTDSEDNSGNTSKRPQRRIKQFIDLSGLASDESNSATNKNNSTEIYFSDDSDQETKKNKITSEIKTISKNRTASAASRYAYSKLEDHSIVTWVSHAGRARFVNGNRIWQELAEQYFNINGLNRSWHSLRNRYLRSILPRLETLELDSVLISRLRAAAATGEIKSRNKAPPRRNSIFGLPTRGALSRRAPRPLSVDEPPFKRQKRDLDVKPPPETNRVLRSSLVTSPEKPSRSPRYSEITRRFAQNYKEDTDTSTPETSRRNSTEAENARNKSPETRNARKVTKTENARNASKLPKATTSRKQSTNKSPETKRSGNLADTKTDTRSPSKTVSNASQRKSLRTRSVSRDPQVATVGNRRKSLIDKFEENKLESATKSRRKSAIDTSRYKSPDLTKSAKKSSEPATKSRRKSVRDRSESPVLSKSATKSRRKSVRDRSESPVLSKSATKSRRKSVRDRSDESVSPVLKISAPKASESATKSRRKSLPNRSPLATSSQKSQSRTKTRKLYNPTAGI